MPAEPAYPGERLGLPEDGPGSVATFPRRLVAIAVDWLLCQLIAIGIFDVPWAASGVQSFVPLAIFAVENLLLVATLGTTVGHRLLGLQVHRLLEQPPGMPGGPLGRLAGAPGPGRALARTALLCLGLPALVWNADGRGLHDQAAGTVIVRAR